VAPFEDASADPPATDRAQDRAAVEEYAAAAECAAAAGVRGASGVPADDDAGHDVALGAEAPLHQSNHRRRSHRATASASVRSPHLVLSASMAPVPVASAGVAAVQDLARLAAAAL